MAEPFVGQITTYGFNFAPRDFARCDGAAISINENPALFALLGTQFGGDGRTTFDLPDMRGRAPVQPDGSEIFQQGLRGGTETHRLNIAEMPTHTHPVYANSGDADVVFNHPTRDEMLAKSIPLGGVDPSIYGNAQSLLNINSSTVSVTGSAAPLAYNIMQPYLVINFCIALKGLFPSRN